jgi:aryl-alcohol dehydrogenase-like predicted oxidoreductase
MAIAKRELGRTGLQVTALGYGAMELRGAPRARDITEAQAETILNEVLEAGINYIDTSIDYEAERGADRPLHLAPAR